MGAGGERARVRGWAGRMQGWGWGALVFICRTVTVCYFLVNREARRLGVTFLETQNMFSFRGALGGHVH